MAFGSPTGFTEALLTEMLDAVTNDRIVDLR
jgi:hypothetical protein